MKALQEKFDIRLWGWSLIFGILLTALCVKLPFISRVTMVWLDLIVINGGFCICLGRYLKRSAKGWSLFVFPIIYLIGCYFFAPRYMLYFALIYLGISYLSWSMAPRDKD